MSDIVIVVLSSLATVAVTYVATVVEAVEVAT